MTVRIPLDKGITHKRIVACKACESTGIRQCSELTDYHRGDYDYWNEFCSHCGGEGRVVEVSHHSVVELEMPNGDTKLHTVQSKYLEPLNGRTTQNIYEVTIRQ